MKHMPKSFHLELNCFLKKTIPSLTKQSRTGIVFLKTHNLSFYFLLCRQSLPIYICIYIVFSALLMTYERETWVSVFSKISLS